MEYRPFNYILIGQTPVPEPDLVTFINWFVSSTEERRVGLDKIDNFQVSTVFLALDHAFEGPPMLFETKVFDRGEPVFEGRCSTWLEAERMHERVVAELRRTLIKVVV